MAVIDKFRGAYFFLSNFYPSPVTWNGVLYPTVEHAYQAAKTLNDADRAWIRQSPTASIAKKRGSVAGEGGRRIAVRENWEPDGKVFAMARLVQRKFRDEGLAAMLLATGDAELCEGNWWGDTFWGKCNGVGENRLGNLLMLVRDNLKEEKC